MNIYVGNLSYQITDEELRTAFENYGEVSSARIIKDKFTEQSKGFGFVEMPRQADAETAIHQMHGTDLKGRTLTVNQARPRNEGMRDRQRHF